MQNLDDQKYLLENLLCELKDIGFANYLQIINKCEQIKIQCHKIIDLEINEL